MSANVAGESGLRDHRIEFVRENSNTDGDPITPSDPAWELFSDRVYNTSWSGPPNLEGDRGLGDVDTDEFDKAPEEHEFTVEYAMQRTLLSGGNPNAAEADGLTRTSEGLLQNTHTVVDRSLNGTIAAGETVNGSTQKASRVYTVVQGGAISTVEISGDPGDQQPFRVIVTYWAEKVRAYQVDQPGTADSLDIVSDDANDTTQTVIIEDDSGNTESNTLTGTTTVTTTKTDWTTIDAVYITDGSGNESETAGTVTISETTSGDALLTIDGSSSYADVEGDPGIPVTESGSHASAVGSSYERTLADTITYGGGSLAFEINSKSIEFDNNLERNVRDDSFKQRMMAGTRDASLSATVYGQVESARAMIRALQNTGSDIVWTFPNAGSITLSSARLTDPGEPNPTATEAQMTLDNTFEPQGGGVSGVTVA